MCGGGGGGVQLYTIGMMWSAGWELEGGEVREKQMPGNWRKGRLKRKVKGGGISEETNQERRLRVEYMR